ncbi:MAG: cation-translocating P-type ATPase [Polyangiaceae bacterium]|nr:cation-translocating P-type ATPase [Polyangiaceae bacterium]
MTELEPATRPGVPGPASGPVPCANCGRPTDPLRAARVAVFGERFRYFCTPDCRRAYDPATTTPLPLPRRTRRGSGDAVVVERQRDEGHELGARRQAAVALARVAPPELQQLEEPLRRAPPELSADEALDLPQVDPPGRRAEVPTELGNLLLLLAGVGGVLAVALLLTGNSPAALTSRLVVAAVATLALTFHVAGGRRDESEIHPAAVLAGPLAALVIALVARVVSASESSSAITLLGLSVACCAAAIVVSERTRRPLDAEREELELVLQGSARRVVGEDVVETRAVDLRPGEEIMVQEGDVVPVDVTLTAGSTTVAPWWGSRQTVSRGEGDALVAGARVLSGRARGVVAWTGHDRAWLRLTSDPRRRADLLAPLARLGKLLAERGAPVAAGLAALAAYAENQGGLDIALFAVTAQLCLANASLAQIGALSTLAGVLTALRRGIVFRTAQAFDDAGKVAIVAFNARGTLLLGEPEVTNIEPVGDVTAERVLALMAGAEAGSTQPGATAVLRAARARGIRPDGVRSPNHVAGLGVTAIASNGKPLVVGSRALMLRERTSVAMAESQITELEALGRTVVLVALGGRLVGVVGLQDGLRPGARAAVQHLLDIGVEPVLLSGDARETCEAIGRTLDIEHVRPEVLPADRGDEITHLADGGALVAVVGKSPVDDIALSAANVAIALDSAGSSASDWSVQLASDDVRDASLGVRIAHESRRAARAGLLIAALPAAGAALLVALTVVPPALGPPIALAGALGALLRRSPLGSGRP